MAEDAASLSRRIDELLSGAIDEQVREQRAINELMVSVRDGISRLVGDMAALSARVTESREASQGLREELPFLVQNEVTAATNTLAQRIDVLETAIGELAGSQSQLEEKLAPDVVVSGVAAKVAELRAASDEAAGSAAVDAAREAVANASSQMRGAFDEAAAGIREALDKQFAQIARRLADAKTQADELDERVGELVSALGVTARLPGDIADTVGRLTSTVESQTASAVRQVQQAAADATEMLQQTVGGIERAANDMNKRFSEMSTRMASFQEQVLAYLQVRDVALEEKRDQIVSEILDEYLSSLPAKERGSTIGKIREAFRRRRDRKDAARYREGSAGALRLPEVPRQAVDRAVGDLVRESRESAARRAAEPAAYEEREYREPPLRDSGEPSPHPAFREPSFREPPSGEPSFREPSPAPVPPEPAPPEPARPEPDPLPRSTSRPVPVGEPGGGTAEAEPAAEVKPKRAAKAAKAVPKRASRSSKKKEPAADAASDPAVAVARSAEPAPPDVLDLSDVDVLEESEGPLEAIASVEADTADAHGGVSDDPEAKPKAKRPSRGKKKEDPEAVAPVPEPGEALAALAAEPDELAAAEEAAEEWEPVSVEPGPESEGAGDLLSGDGGKEDSVEAPSSSERPRIGGEARGVAPGGDDTLAEALARVEALVAQHRDPSRRKAPPRKPKKDE